jgi:hypothetical protein
MVVGVYAEKYFAHWLCLDIPRTQSGQALALPIENTAILVAETRNIRFLLLLERCGRQREL